VITQPNTCIEHTNLQPDLSDQEIDQLIEEAKTYQFLGICVPPFWVKKVSRELADSDIRIVTVIGFPLGYQRTESKIHEIELAITDGADELDLMMNVSAFKAGISWPKIEMAKAAKTAHEHGKLLKVIVETALLSENELTEASKIVSDSGADFIKTSTGFASRGASVRDIEIMKANISSDVGIKASGGIKTLVQLQELVAAGAERVGSSSGVNIMTEFQNV